MIRAIDSNTEQKIESLSAEDVVMAKKACPCCSGEPDALTDSFTEAQLLQKGHAIQLHALKYRIALYPKRKRKKTGTVTADKLQPLTETTFSVGLPMWAQNLVSESDLQWLD